MGISGFPIKGGAEGTFEVNEPWFQGVTGTFATVTNVGGFANIVTPTNAGAKVGDIIYVDDDGGGNYPGVTGTITALPNATNIETDITFNGTDLGNYVIPASIAFEDTPDNVLREIHVQFDTSVSVEIQVSLDGGSTYMALNNAIPLIGLATFTMFVIDTTLLNFRTPTATVVAEIVVTSA